MTKARAFIAVKLNDQCRKALAATLADLRRIAPPKAISWVRPENLHVTMKFLGDIVLERAPELIGAVAASLDDIKSFDIEVRGLGTFGGRNPSVVWAGVDDPGEHLTTIFNRIETHLERIGYPPEGKAYRPHVTLGRVREHSVPAPFISKIDAGSSTVFGSVLVDEITLFGSKLTQEGAIYETLDRVPLVIA